MTRTLIPGLVPLSQHIPDTGQLRTDVLTLLRRVSKRYSDFGPDIVEALMSELPDVQEQIFHVLPEVTVRMVERAAQRGEVARGPITLRIAALPLDLVRHEMFVTHAPVPDGVLTEIVDDIFLPLVRARTRSA